MMLYMALAAFAAGATAGIFLAFRHFVRKRLPVWVALAHGVGGATGFTLVLLTVVREPGFWLVRQALYLFIVTIALGCVNLLFHVRGVRHRTMLILMHALCAVSGVGTLIYAVALHGSPAAEAQAVPSAESQPVVAAAPVSPKPEAPSAEPVVDPATRRMLADPSIRRTLASPVSFATDSPVVLPASRPVIADIAGVLKAHPEISLIEVQGHADERGDEKYNLELTRARAAAVVDALVANGVARERMHSAGYGSRCPADVACRAAAESPKSCHDMSRWGADRRVVLVILQAGAFSFHGEVVCDRAAELIPPEDVTFHGGE